MASKVDQYRSDRTKWILNRIKTSTIQPLFIVAFMKMAMVVCDVRGKGFNWWKLDGEL